MQRATRGNLATHGEKLASQSKLFVRDRIDRLIDEGSFVEDGLLANANAPNDDLPADGVVTGRGLIDGRPVAIMANDPTVKAGSWGARTVEKIVRLTELALREELPIAWLVDSAGGRITDQVELFPGRRGAGRIFYNQVKLSGRVPQVCCLFGPSAAGGAYIPAFCDVVFMVDGNASMYLGSPRMAEEVIGEVVSLNEMGGAKMHASVSGVGDNLGADDRIVISHLDFVFLQRTWMVRRASRLIWSMPRLRPSSAPRRVSTSLREPSRTLKRRLGRPSPDGASPRSAGCGARRGTTTRPPAGGWPAARSPR